MDFGVRLIDRAAVMGQDLKLAERQSVLLVDQ
ncbi:hypothetical protein SGRI78S_00902 [Streptomyces griseus subsp. griseus]